MKKLYVCPKCGGWNSTSGGAELLMQWLHHAQCRQVCPDCRIPMRQYSVGEHLAPFRRRASRKTVQLAAVPMQQAN